MNNTVANTTGPEALTTHIDNQSSDHEEFLKWKASQPTSPIVPGDPGNNGIFSAVTVPGSITNTVEATQTDHPIQQQTYTIVLPKITIPAQLSGYRPKIEEIIQSTIEAISNPRFWNKDSRAADLLAATQLPTFSDRSLQQFYNHAMDDLITEAAKKSSSQGTPVVMPTEEEVKAEAWTRYTAKQMIIERKSLQAQRKQEAERTGGRPVKVTEEEVSSRVESIIANLKAAEGC